LNVKYLATQLNAGLEEGADRVASAVLRMPETALTHDPSGTLSQSETPPIQRRALASMPANAPNLQQSLGPGQPLDSQSRAYFEPRFGHDFGRVRIHADGAAGESARSLNALAYTTGRNIVFANGQFAPHTPTGQRLLAHELAHVVQQGQHTATGSTSRAPGIIQRQQAPGAAAQQRPIFISNSAQDQRQWRQRVDRAVRRQFRLRGTGLSGGRVRFVDEATFGQLFPASQLEEHLLTIFLDYGDDGRYRPGQILDYNREPYYIAGFTSTTYTRLQAFIRDGVRAGEFVGQTREYDVTTGARFPPFRIKPGELVAEFVAGVTSITGPRAGRRVVMQEGASVRTLVHETCHFYISDRFRNMALGRPDGGEFLGGTRISQILLEGFAEYFARDVMATNAAQFGPPPGQAYETEVIQVRRIAATLGRSVLERAYFHGDARAIRQVEAALDAYKDTHEDLLVPPSVVNSRIRQRRAARP